MGQVGQVWDRYGTGLGRDRDGTGTVGRDGTGSSTITLPTLSLEAAATFKEARSRYSLKRNLSFSAYHYNPILMMHFIKTRLSLQFKVKLC